MESPKCRLCGRHHWGNCEFATTHDDKVEVISAVTQPVDGSWVDELPWRHPVRQRMSNMPEELEGIPLLLDKESNGGKFDKRAYQREYMRKRRSISAR
uniref:Uncharacterized protein n=1 Tax=viral metagenome TaxID=1070528 RepID=A0A6M3IUY3_9ZZZZ